MQEHNKRTTRWSRARNTAAAACLAGLLIAVVAAPLGAATNPDGTIDMPIKGSFDAGSSFYQAHLTASDINADGKKEVLVGNVNGRLYCFDSRAGLLWYKDTGGAIQGAPVCYDVDGDGKQEIWVGDLNGKVWGLDCQGGVLEKWGWPRQTHKVEVYTGAFSSPAIGDVDGDGTPDIVVGTYGHFIYAWRYTGEILPGWPYNNADTVWSSPALADIDEDGIKEIIIGADATGGPGWPYPPGGLLYAFNGDATILQGFPRTTPEVIWSSPAVSDINGDGHYEIVVGMGHYYTAIGKLTTEGMRVLAFNRDGTDVAGWPAAAAGCTFSSPALGDIDDDGTNEIVIGTNAVGDKGADHAMAFKPNGRAMLDIKGFGGPMMGSPALGDVNSDGKPDIVMGSGVQMCAWDYTGKVLWSQNMNNFVVTSPVVDDLDGDGIVEVALATGDAPGGAFPGGKFYVFDCGPKAGSNSTVFPWPMFRLNPEHHATLLTGLEPSPPPPYTQSKTWYLAEGSTGKDDKNSFETWVLVQNPNDTATWVDMTYMTPGGAVVGPRFHMQPGTRKTVNVADTVPDTWEVSTKVEAEKDVVVERSMYGNNRKIADESIGVTAPGKTWYMAEGSTGVGMETWILVQNPNDQGAVVQLTYMTTTGSKTKPNNYIPPKTRVSFRVSDTVPNTDSVATMAQSDRPVVVERSMYGNNREWAHNSAGISVPASTWYLAEGSTGRDDRNNFETWVLVQNPNDPEANVRIIYMTPGGPVYGPTVTIAPRTRMTFHVPDTVPGTWEVSTFVESDKPVVAERAMYGNGRKWGHDSIGTALPKKTWYLAEGSTGPGMETWILVQNPGSEQAWVEVTYMTPEGPTAGPAQSLPPRTRTTFFVANTVQNAWEVSTKVTSDRPVVAERAMYNGERTWATDSIGFAP